MPEVNVAEGTDWVTPAGIRVARGATFDGPRIIFDSDYGPDVDDLVAHAILHALADLDECQIVAQVACISNAKSPGAMDAVSTWHGRPSIPTGGFMGTVDGSPLFPNGGQGESDGDAWAVAIYDADATYPRTVTDSNFDDAVDVYRQALASSPDGSVRIVTVGMLNVLSAVLDSAGDGIDARNGSDLMAAKCEGVWIMGGRLSGNEFNLRHASAEASNVADNCPVPIYWSRAEIGNTIFAGKWSGSEREGHVVRFGMEAYDHIPGSDGNGRQSWDAMNALLAVRGTEAGFGLAQGTMTVDAETGGDTWTAGTAQSDIHWLVSKTLSDGDYETVLEPLVWTDQGGS